GVAAPGELLLGDVELEQALVHVDDDAVAVLDQADQPALGRLRGDVADGDAAGAPGEPAVGDQGAGLPELAALEERRGVEHLLHAGTALRALVADDHHVPGLHRLFEDLLDRLLLRVADHRRSEEHTSELQSRFDLVCRLFLEYKNHNNELLPNSSPLTTP